jgi:hypothetical protein
LRHYHIYTTESLDYFFVFYLRVRTGLPRFFTLFYFSTNLIVTLHEFRAVPTVFHLFGVSFPRTPNFYFIYFFFRGSCWAAARYENLFGACFSPCIFLFFRRVGICNFSCVCVAQQAPLFFRSSGCCEPLFFLFFKFSVRVTSFLSFAFFFFFFETALIWFFLQVQYN